jgi:hypothetical protein
LWTPLTPTPSARKLRGRYPPSSHLSRRTRDAAAARERTSTVLYRREAPTQGEHPACTGERAGERASGTLEWAQGHLEIAVGCLNSPVLAPFVSESSQANQALLCRLIRIWTPSSGTLAAGLTDLDHPNHCNSYSSSAWAGDLGPKPCYSSAWPRPRMHHRRGPFVAWPAYRHTTSASSIAV